MRIAHVVPTYLPATRYGGPIYSVHGLCKGLAAHGHDVHVFTTSVDGPGDSAVPHGVPVELDGVKVWYFHSRQLRRLYWSPPLGSALARQIASFDVLHLHSVFLWPTNHAARLARRAGVPYVLSPRGMLVRELIREKNALIKLAWLALIESSTVRHAALMHYTSTREAHEASRVFPRLPPSCVVPNGVEPPPSSLALLGHQPSERVRAVLAKGPFCLFLGRVHWVKGIDRLLRALAGSSARLLICGNDEEGYLPQVQQLVQTLGLADRVELIDPVFGLDKWLLLSAARMLVLPSLSENFGNVVPEAMSMGCPVITTTNVGSAEIVREAQAGIVCSGEEHELRRAIETLWNDDALRQAAAGRAAQYVSERLLWSQIALRMLGAYERARENNTRA